MTLTCKRSILLRRGLFRFRSVVSRSRRTGVSSSYRRNRTDDRTLLCGLFITNACVRVLYPGRDYAEHMVLRLRAIVVDFFSRKPQQLATSPLENLLIEHASMSVYHHSVTEESASAVSPISTIGEDYDEELMDIDMKKSRQSVCPDKPNKYYLSRSKDLTATATPTVPHLKSQKVRNFECFRSSAQLPPSATRGGFSRVPIFSKSAFCPSGVSGGGHARRPRHAETRSSVEPLPARQAQQVQDDSRTAQVAS